METAGRGPEDEGRVSTVHAVQPGAGSLGTREESVFSQWGPGWVQADSEGKGSHPLAKRRRPLPADLQNISTSSIWAASHPSPKLLGLVRLSAQDPTLRKWMIFPERWILLVWYSVD